MIHAGRVGHEKASSTSRSRRIAPLRGGLRRILYCALLSLPTGLAAQSQSAHEPSPSPTVDIHASDPSERWYSAGRDALARLDYAQARDALRASLALREDPIARADLGRALLGLQQYELAREQFQRALASDPPPSARALLERFLSLAEQERTQTSPWQWRLGLGRMHDSNANFGPQSASVTLYGLPFTLARDVTARSDQATMLNVSAFQWRPIDASLHWVSEAALSVVRYDALRDFDMHTLLLETGPAYTAFDGAALLQMGLRHTTLLLGESPNFKAWGLTPQVRYRQRPGLEWQAQVLAEQRHHDVSDLLSASIRQVRLAALWQPVAGLAWTLEPGLLARREHAGDAAFSHLLTGASVALRGSASDQLRLGLELADLHARYEGIESWADASRRDRRRIAAATASQAIARGLYVKASLIRTLTRSNLEVYRTQRTQAMLELSQDF